MKKTFITLSLMLGIAVLSSAQTNLLTNPGAESNYDGWIKTDGGNGWSINVVELGDMGTPHSGTNFWVSSYEYCTLAQTIDLISAGYSQAVLDAAPDITAGAFIATNTRTESVATIKVELCAADGAVISTHFVCNNFVIPTNTTWMQKSLVIKGYGAGVRKVNFYLIGKDMNWWYGHFGAQFDDAYLSIAVSPTTAIDEASIKTITVLPNPASDFITLGESSGLIRIYDLKGSLVLSHNAIANEKIDIRSLNNGVYVLKTGHQNIKLVKK